MKQLFWTFKDRFFAFRDKHPDMHLRELYEKFKDTPKSTVRGYDREWKYKHKTVLAENIGHIERVLYILQYKFTIEKELSIQEKKSLEKVGELVDAFREGDIG